MPPEHFYEFDKFRLYPEARQLLHNDQPIALTAKELTVLIILVRNSGRLVSYRELKESAWPGLHVVEGNISQTIYKLRGLLGDTSNEQRFIENVPKRGYRFVAKVIEHSSWGQQILPDIATSEQDEFPLQSTKEEQTAKRSIAKSFIIVGSLLFFCAVISVLIWTYIKAKAGPAPHVDNVRLLTKPTSGTQFYVQVSGSGFDPDAVRVVITGPGCATFGACNVPNGAIKQFGSITYSRIERVPITAGFGDYRIFVQNGTNSEPSTGFLIRVGLAGEP